MKLITLNTWGGRVREPFLQFITDKSAEIDVFCFQEIYSQAEGKETQEEYKNDNLDLFGELSNILKETHTGYFSPALSDYYGLATFVRNGLNVSDHGDTTIFNGITGNYSQHRRNLQYTKIDNTLVCNIHGLWNGQGKTDTPDRIEQSHNIQKFLQGRSEKIVLCGDFNLLPDTESMSILEKDLVNLIKKFNITNTRSQLYTKSEKFADYILVSPSIEVRSFEVLPDVVSDHLALQLDFIS